MTNKLIKSHQEVNIYDPPAINSFFLSCFYDKRKKKELKLNVFTEVLIQYWSAFKSSLLTRKKGFLSFYTHIKEDANYFPWKQVRQPKKRCSGHDTILHSVVRLQFLGSRKCRAPLHYHYSLIHLNQIDMFKYYWYWIGMLETM